MFQDMIKAKVMLSIHKCLFFMLSRAPSSSFCFLEFGKNNNCSLKIMVTMRLSGPDCAICLSENAVLIGLVWPVSHSPINVSDLQDVFCLNVAFLPIFSTKRKTLWRQPDRLFLKIFHLGDIDMNTSGI